MLEEMDAGTGCLDAGDTGMLKILDAGDAKCWRCWVLLYHSVLVVPTLVDTFWNFSESWLTVSRSSASTPHPM